MSSRLSYRVFFKVSSRLSYRVFFKRFSSRLSSERSHLGNVILCSVSWGLSPGVVTCNMELFLWNGFEVCRLMLSSGNVLLRTAFDVLIWECCHLVISSGTDILINNPFLLNFFPRTWFTLLLRLCDGKIKNVNFLLQREINYILVILLTHQLDIFATLFDSITVIKQNTVPSFVS